MSSEKEMSTRDFLASIDKNLTVYEDVLIRQGFTSTRVLPFLQPQDVQNIPSGLGRLLMYHCKRLASPGSASSRHEATRGGSLQPKRLFNNADDIPANFPSDLDILRSYECPLEKHLSDLKADVKKAEEKIRNIQGEINECTKNDNDGKDQYGNSKGPVCGGCHIRGHKITSCLNPRCEKSVQCGILKKHPKEFARVQKLRAELSKEVKQRTDFQKEVAKAAQTLDREKKSFNYCIKGHLIKSNVNKYMLQIEGGQWIPLTSQIEDDSSILALHYNNIIPADLKTEMLKFRQIIDTYNAQYEIKSPTISDHMNEKLAGANNSYDRGHIINDGWPLNNRVQGEGGLTCGNEALTSKDCNSSADHIQALGRSGLAGTGRMPQHNTYAETVPHCTSGHVSYSNVADHRQTQVVGDTSSVSKRQYLRPSVAFQNYQTSPPSKNVRYNSNAAQYSDRRNSLSENASLLYNITISSTGSQPEFISTDGLEVTNDVSSLNTQMKSLNPPNRQYNLFHTGVDALGRVEQGVLSRRVNGQEQIVYRSTIPDAVPETPPSTPANLIGAVTNAQIASRAQSLYMDEAKRVELRQRYLAQAIHSQGTRVMEGNINVAYCKPQPQQQLSPAPRVATPSSIVATAKENTSMVSNAVTSPIRVSSWYQLPNATSRTKDTPLNLTQARSMEHNLPPEINAVVRATQLQIDKATDMTDMLVDKCQAHGDTEESKENPVYEQFNVRGDSGAVSEITQQSLVTTKKNIVENPATERPQPGN